MSKNTKMIKVFLKVLNNDKKETKLVLPNCYQKSIYTINYQSLKKQGFTTLLFDIDNTIMLVNSIEVTSQLQDLFQKLKQDFKIGLMSNNDLKRVYPVIEKLQVNGIGLANKPEKDGFERILKILKTNKEKCVMIGDQMLTDIYGGNQYGIYTILVEPYQNKYDIKTGVSRILQNIVMKKLNNKITRYKYY